MMEKSNTDIAVAVNNTKEEWSLPKFEVIGVEKTKGGTAISAMETTFVHPIS